MKDSHRPSIVRLTAVVVATMLVTLLLAGCRNQQTAAPTISATDATQEPAVTPEGNTPQATAPSGDTANDVWATVQERGRLIVGTSADYPPFAFYNDEFELEGYDVALARLLGERLGVEVEFNDMAFDGLGGALQVGQIDAAIAAISITDQRREAVDFSNLYYVSEGAALARADSGITIARLEDLADHRVAVQAGTVYETWLQESAVDTGILPADNLLVYVTSDQALTDLRAGLVDVIVADLLPLEVAARDQSLQLVGRDLNRQRFAVAMARGSSLLSPINTALFDLQNEGELARLAATYLDLEQAELQPLPDPAASPEATTPEATTAAAVQEPSRAAGCIDAMTLIAHLSLDDDGMRSPPPVSPGTPFTKTWRLLNNGTCTWGSGYVLTPVGGNVPQASMGASPTPIDGPVAPGETTDVTVNLVAPLQPGVYQGFWTMRNPSGLLFGDRIWVGITVPAQPTPTPPPTAAPAPGINFVVDRSSIRAGECVIFSWNVINAAAVYFYAQGQPWEPNQVATFANRTECPPVTTSYNLRVAMSDGTVDTRTIRIDVQATQAAPTIESFTVSPGPQVTAGQCVDVRWRVSGEVSSIRVTRNDTTLWNAAPLTGTSRDCPPAGEAAYAIEATGPGGVSRALQNVTVMGQPATPAPGTVTPTPTGQLPTINSFTVTPSRIFVGHCLTIAWSVTGNVNRVQLRRDGVLVLDFAVFNGNVTDCLNSEGTYTYRLDAANAAGGSVFQQAIVTVVR